MGKLLNSYFYGKAGKADYTTDDLPHSRMQLFKEMLRIRLSGICRMNLLYMLIWLPTMIVLLLASINMVNLLISIDDTKFENIVVAEGEAAPTTVTVQVEDSNGEKQDVTYYTSAYAASVMKTLVWSTLLILIPCIAITGPFTAGAARVVRNWARDEHSFMMSDFKDAVKENWKQSLAVSFVTGAMPFVAYEGWLFYDGLIESMGIVMVVPKVLMLMLFLIWSLAVTYAHPLIVGYKLRLRDVFRNSLILAVARLPMSIGIRLLHCMPLVLAYVALMFVQNYYLVIMILFFYYAFIGFGLSRFVTASYVNGVFDKYINSRIEGAVVNRGIAVDEDDDDLDDEEPQA